MTNTTAHTIVLAAGGTGGHIFPAEALAEELRTRGHRVVLVTDKRFIGYSGAFAQTEMRVIRAGTLGGGFIRRLKSVIDIAIGIWQARSLLRKLSPVAVVGFGGYPSFPTMLAACQLGIPTIIHEQNAVLGRANRVLANKVKVIATSFPDTTHISLANLAKVTLTGNPVRSAIRILHDIAYPELTQDGAIRILVTGGSQGASIFSEILPAAIATLPASLRGRIRIDQQCREEDIEVTRAAYKEINVSADLATFFTDVPARMASTHLVIARSGASTVAELTAAGRPAILVPLPTAMDNHQNNNANAIEDAGGGWVIPQPGFTAATVAARIESFLTLPASLARAAKNARSAGRINAAKDLATLVVDVAEGRHAVKTAQSAPVINSEIAQSLAREQAA